MRRCGDTSARKMRFNGIYITSRNCLFLRLCPWIHFLYIVFSLTCSTFSKWRLVLGTRTIIWKTISSQYERIAPERTGHFRFESISKRTARRSPLCGAVRLLFRTLFERDYVVFQVLELDAGKSLLASSSRSWDCLQSDVISATKMDSLIRDMVIARRSIAKLRENLLSNSAEGNGEKCGSFDGSTLVVVSLSIGWKEIFCSKEFYGTCFMCSKCGQKAPSETATNGGGVGRYWLGRCPGMICA